MILISCSSIAAAQVDSTTIDSLEYEKLRQNVLDSYVPADTVERDRAEQEPEVLFEVIPWEFHAPLLSKTTATDSTLRWQIWPDWTYKLNREPGVISYRLGSALKSNAVQKFAHEPRHQELYWEDISLNDPVSGFLYWPLISHHRISNFYEQDLGTGYRSTYFLRQYYLNEPLSRLIYSESKFTTRSLDFEVSHNLSHRTNFELSYWDRRDGGEYSNSEVTGRKIFGRITHHLDPRRLIKLNYVNDKYNISQPFGYVMPNMLLFNFDRFTTSANMSSAESDNGTSLLALNFYQRAPDTTLATDNLHAGIFYKGDQRSLTYTADTTRYKIRSAGANIRKWHNIGNLKLEGAASHERFFNSTANTGNLFFDDWSLSRAEAKASFQPVPQIRLEGGGEYRRRSDGYFSYRMNVTPEFSIGKLVLQPGASAGMLMPTMQQLYWQSEWYTGDPNLQSELVREVRGLVKYNFSSRIHLGLRGQHKDIDRGVMIGPDSTFANISPYASQSLVAFLDLDSDHFEFDGSATVHRFTNHSDAPASAIPMSPRERIWLKGSLYWKGYLFDRATYVKAGLSGMITPFQYQADSYNPVLDYWQPVSQDQFLPRYNRLDLDISARIRSIVVTLRWENILNDVAQLGYFETARYPMSQRRFIFGIQALFRN